MRKLFVIVLGLLFIALASVAQIPNEQLNVKEIQRVLKKNKDLRWEADDTWINKRSLKELKLLLGDASPELVSEGITFEKSYFQKDGDVLPSAYDWRNLNGVDFVTPVLNQGNCGSCVAFSTIGTLETQVNITVPFSFPKFSTQSLFSCAGGGCSYGMAFETAIAYLESMGVPDEACHPYVSGSTGKDDMCTSGCSDISTRSYKILSVNRPTANFKNIDVIKKALLNGPVLTRMTVYDDFFSYRSGVYKHVYGKVAGGHGVSIIGYDDLQRAWIVKNSWGPSWGNKGFVLISYDDISGVGQTTWQFEVPRADGYARVVYPQNRTFVSDTLTIKTENAFVNLPKTKIFVYDRNKNLVHESSCETVKCDINVETINLSDGRYEVFAQATDNNQKTIDSQHEYFYILNNFSKMNLNLNAKDIDLSSPVSGKIEFSVEADTAGIPLSSVELRVASNGNEIYTKYTDTVEPQMIMSWRTTTVPNGKYEVYLVGSLTVGDKVHKTESARLHVTINN